MKLIFAVLAKLLASEAEACLPKLTAWLLGHAVSRLPEEQRDRLREEWSADLQSYPGAIAKSVRAFGFCVASERIRRIGRVSIFKMTLGALWYLFFLRPIEKDIRQLPGVLERIMDLRSQMRTELIAARDEKRLEEALAGESIQLSRASLRREASVLNTTIKRLRRMVGVAKLLRIA